MFCQALDRTTATPTERVSGLFKAPVDFEALGSWNSSPLHTLLGTLGVKMVAVKVVPELNTDTWFLCLKKMAGNIKLSSSFYLVGSIKGLISMNEA